MSSRGRGRGRGGAAGGGGGGSSKLRGHPRDSPDVQLSKTLSYLLRHGAEKEKLPIRADGFVSVRDLFANPRLKDLTFSKLQEMVQKDSKGRYNLVHEPESANSMDDLDGWWIRANQGHSLQVKLDYAPLTDHKTVPMAVHGTSKDAWNAISTSGLSKMKRTHIHLAQGIPGSGVISGMRNTSDILIHIDLERALAAGIKFFLSTNGVVLTEGDASGFLPPTYFSRVENRKGEALPGWEGKPGELSVAAGGGDTGAGTGDSAATGSSITEKPLDDASASSTSAISGALGTEPVAATDGSVDVLDKVVTKVT